MEVHYVVQQCEIKSLLMCNSNINSEFILKKKNYNHVLFWLHVKNKPKKRKKDENKD